MIVPDGPVRTSNLAVPGVVTTFDIRPASEIFIIRPMYQKLLGNTILLFTGMHDAAAAAVSVGPSPCAVVSSSLHDCTLINILLLSDLQNVMNAVDPGRTQSSDHAAR
jgi:hypothetical protein